MTDSLHYALTLGCTALVSLGALALTAGLFRAGRRLPDPRDTVYRDHLGREYPRLDRAWVKGRRVGR